MRAHRLSKKWRRRLKTLRQRPADPYLVPWPADSALSEHAARVAENAQRERQGPAIFIHGVMPRSGSVYLGELLRLHPGLCAFPNDMWEVPVLPLAHQLSGLQTEFLNDYSHNRSKLGGGDFLSLFGNAFLDYLYAFQSEPRRRLLLKEAGVRNLGAFPLMFPCEHLLLLLRDGRDVVHSTMKTWPSTDFVDTCREWSRSTNAVLEYYRLNEQRRPTCMLVRYESVQEDPAAFIRDACERFGLDVERYPFDRTSEVRLIGSSSIAGKGDVDWSKHEAKPDHFRSGGHWQDWPKKWKKTFDRIAGDTLRESGYV